MAFVHGVLDGSMPGRIFVDEIQAQRSAVVLNDSGFHFAIGEAPAVLTVSELAPVIAAVSDEPAALWSSTPAWAALLGPLFERNDVRKEFHAPEGRLYPLPILPRGFDLTPIDEAIAAKFGGGTDPWVIRTWGGSARFVERCFGFAIMHGDILASFCTACAIGGPPGAVEAEIEIGTDPRYRRRGLATIAAVAFMAECRDRGLLPAWTCTATNVASDRLARRLGFTFFREITGYAVHRDMQLVEGRWRMPPAL